MGLAVRRTPRTIPVYFDIELHPKQEIAFDTPATEVLYGGAAGGGKSHLMRMATIAWCAAIPGLQVYLFRRIREDLMKNHMEGPKGFRALLAPWVNKGFCKIIEDEIRFRNGSKIYLCHCKDPKDVYKYQGAEIHVLVIDELTHFLEGMYRFLRNRVRMVGLRLPPEYEGRFPRILCSANPGNIGHLWVKRTWISGREPLKIERMADEEGGMRRQYIPARIDDNPSLGIDDPGYEKRLSGLGSVALVKAMRDGDWDVVEGAFFSEWSNRRHVVQPFELPKEWTRFVAVDWGSYRPFSIGWYAVVGENTSIPGTTTHMPRGALVRYREWYGCVEGKDNVGLKLTVEAVADGILERSLPDQQRGITYAYTVVDPSMFQENGGPSMRERMLKRGIRNLRAGDNTRVAQKGAMGGWDMVRARLRGSGWTQDGPGPEWVPDFYVFSTCVHFIRTVPVLQHDPDRPEDLDTDGEDHAADEGRYAVLSRPYTARPVEDKPKPQELVYEAKPMPDGTVRVVANLNIMEIVERRMLARKKGWR
ncbi:phage terminase large subunit [Microvirga arabica]|uniref:Phage terminase large subunit n=1 Tax=Microvirga arabica TaxID=1128671 RepID=A0ABV6YEI6_9HYPH